MTSILSISALSRQLRAGTKRAAQGLRTLAPAATPRPSSRTPCTGKLPLRMSTLLIIAGFLSACSGASNVAPTTAPPLPNNGVQAAAANPQSEAGSNGAVSSKDALAIAQRRDSSHATLPVAPSSLTLTLPNPQTLTVTVKRKTVVFAASSDPEIATVSPNYVVVNTITSGSGTATFTVTPRASGKAFIGLIDSQWMYAIVPVTVSAKVGASKIYVANNGNNTVTTYNADGSASTPTITAGLNFPTGIAVDAAGEIYVANIGNNTVTTYAADGGNPILTITAAAGLNAPSGIAVH